MTNLYKKIKGLIKGLLSFFGLYGPLKYLYFYGGKFYCPCCGGHFRKMQPYNASSFIKGRRIEINASNALCPRCGSHMRYRFMLTYLRNHTNIFKKKLKLLQFAPERATADILRKQENIEYFSGDLDPTLYGGTTKLDVTDIDMPDNSFDMVIVSHVLEHVVDDVRAMSEIYRIIKPGGTAIIVVPLYDESYEIADLDFAGREKMYGIGHHVRLNSLTDFKHKLESQSFKVGTCSIEDVPGNYVDREDRSLYTKSDYNMFICKK